MEAGTSDKELPAATIFGTFGTTAAAQGGKSGRKFPTSYPGQATAQGRVHAMARKDAEDAPGVVTGKLRRNLDPLDFLNRSN
ncbi:hypothetical protein NL676_012161 [Syzygium grande]|nr:hypothetical protein NL676_012161 [Syzygium grande]